MIDVTIVNIEELRATFAALLPEIQRKVLRGLAQAAFNAAQDQADTHTQTGALARSLRLRSDKEGGWIIDHDQQHAPYAPFVHWGSRPHVIKPRDKKALRWPSGGWGNTGFIFAKWVHHPGYEGDPYLINAANEAIRQFDDIVHRAGI